MWRRKQPLRSDWYVDAAVGSAAAFHAREMPDTVSRSVWLFDADRPALVSCEQNRKEFGL